MTHILFARIASAVESPSTVANHISSTTYAVHDVKLYTATRRTCCRRVNDVAQQLVVDACMATHRHEKYTHWGRMCAARLAPLCPEVWVTHFWAKK